MTLIEEIQQVASKIRELCPRGSQLDLLAKRLEALLKRFCYGMTTPDEADAR